MKFLYWNIGRNNVAPLLAEMAREHNPDLMILSEFTGTIAKLLDTVNPGLSRQYRAIPGMLNPGDPLTLSRLPRRSHKLVKDDSGVSLVAVSAPGQMEILLVVVHLPSKLHMSEAEQASLVQRLRLQIEAAEGKRKHHRTVVVGDLNMNPFELGVVGSEHLHAVMCRKVAIKGTREVKGKTRRFFYNPMWSLLGDRSGGPPGTYHYNSGSVVNYYWNMFDQVLVRPDLIEKFVDDDLLVVTVVGDTHLLTDSGVPNKRVGSDHLPIVFGLDLL